MGLGAMYGKLNPRRRFLKPYLDRVDKSPLPINPIDNTGAIIWG